MNILRNRRGFTLEEVLVAAVLLAAFSAVCLSALTAAFGTRGKIVGYSRADTLASTLLLEIQNELRFAQNVRVTEEGLVYDSEIYGENAVIGLDGGRAAVFGGIKKYPLVNAGAYGSLHIEQFAFSRRESAIDVSFEICSAKGRRIKSCSFSVYSLNR